MATIPGQASERWGPQLRGFARRAGRFGWALLQMIVAMKVGMLIYHLNLKRVLAGSDFAALHAEYPVFGHWMMVAAMAVAMIVFMRYYHKSTWQFCAEMTLAMLVPPAVLTVPVLRSRVPIEFLQVGSNWLMIPAMAALMLYRRGHHVHFSRQPSYGRIPRWVKVVGIIGLVVVLLFIILRFSRDQHHHESGGHGRLSTTAIS
jgi:hypothetical protein